MAEPTGNICHKGTFSCFGDEFQIIKTEDTRVSINKNCEAQIKNNSQAIIKEGAQLSRNNIVKGGVISNLISTIRDRHEKMPEGSYTAQLFRKGTTAIAQKVGEEAVEVVVEAVKGDRERLVYELADLAYHTLVLMENEGISTGDLNEELKKRSS
jgi:phosphoribosyl-ATP pyrophosphohydrolase